MDVKIIGRIRKSLEAIDFGAPGDDEQITLTSQLEQLVALGASPYGEITRIGRAFKTGTAAAVAAVVAIPTTACMYAIYNNEPDGGRSYVIDWVAAQNVVSTAVAGQAQILLNLGQVREASPTDATPAGALVKMNGLGGGTSDTRMRSILTATALPATTGVAAAWFPWGLSAVKPGVAGTPGYGIWAPVDGRIIVPPGRYLAMHVLANVVGETFVVALGWHERQLQLG